MFPPQSESDIKRIFSTSLSEPQKYVGYFNKSN